MPIRKETIRQQIQRIRMAYKKRDISTGQLYNTEAQRKRSYKKITLIGMFVSDENTFLIRPHVFEKNDAMSPRQWEAWFSRHYNAEPEQENGHPGVLFQILDGMENRTGKQWRLYRIIGWVAGDNTGLVRSRARKARNKTEPSRRKNGRNRTRRRQ